MVDYMKNLGARMVDNGFHILPLAPGQKYPAIYGIGGWRHMPRWDRYGLRQPTPLELAHWAWWPGAGIGVVCGAVVVAIDIDFPDPQQAHLASCITREYLGETPACRIGAAPKSLLVYRVDQAVASASLGGFEILGSGRQFVSYGIHPITRNPYNWPVEGLADLSPDDLPKVTRGQVEELCATVSRAFPDECAQVAALAPRMSSLKSDVALNADLETIKSALSHIPNAALPYADWMRVGMALKGALGAAGADLFHNWSAQSTKNVPQVTAKAWLSYRPDRIGAGTIFHIARSNGWIRSVPDYKAHPGRKFFSELASHV